MNRREMMKSVGALAVVGAVPVAAQADLSKPILSNRLLRYKKYDEMSMDWKYFKKLDELSFVVHEKLCFVDHNPIIDNLIVYGDCFIEIKDGKPSMEYILPPWTMYRIETTKGRLLEFQQSATSPDYKALISNTDSSSAIRFKPEQIIHHRVNAADPSVAKEIDMHYEASNRSALPFYPYGYSPMEVWSNGKEVNLKKFCIEVERTLSQSKV